MRFENKTVIITGGDKGIGRAVVLAFAKEGANTVIGYNRDLDSAKKTGRMVENEG
ncbi:hypothetical protein LCGC14_2059330, partial [marine sediment metagenome]